VRGSPAPPCSPTHDGRRSRTDSLDHHLSSSPVPTPQPGRTRRCRAELLVAGVAISVVNAPYRGLACMIVTLVRSLRAWYAVSAPSCRARIRWGWGSVSSVTCPRVACDVRGSPAPPCSPTHDGRRTRTGRFRPSPVEFTCASQTRFDGVVPSLARTKRAGPIRAMTRPAPGSGDRVPFMLVRGRATGRARSTRRVRRKVVR
jgi:hypothetical protein